jgi:hypothetical protein
LVSNVPTSVDDAIIAVVLEVEFDPDLSTGRRRGRLCIELEFGAGPIGTGRGRVAMLSSSSAAVIRSLLPNMGP